MILYSCEFEGKNHTLLPTQLLETITFDTVISFNPFMSIAQIKTDTFFFFNNDSIEAHKPYSNIVQYDFRAPRNWDFSQPQSVLYKLVSTDYQLSGQGLMPLGHHGNLSLNGVEILAQKGRLCSHRNASFYNGTLYAINKDSLYFIPFDGIYDHEWNCLFSHHGLQKNYIHGFFIRLTKSEFYSATQTGYVQHNINCDGINHIRCINFKSYHTKIGTTLCPRKAIEQGNNNYFVYFFSDIKN